VSGPRMFRRPRRVATLIGLAAVLAAGIIVLSTQASNAGESCQGLDTALRNNLNFIATQKAHPDAQSAGRIANRQAVVDLIQQRRKAAGCTDDVSAQPAPGSGNGQQQGSGENCAALGQALQNNLNFIAGQKAHPDANSAARIANRQAVVDLIQQRRTAAGCSGDVAAPPDTGNAGNHGSAGGSGQAGGTGKGNVVCPGTTVTLSGEAGAPAASSGKFPVGTKLKVTNLDNKKSTTVTVRSASGSCVLLNNAAFEKVREPGKFLIRHVVVERIG
jgi:hypothetical protein